MADQLQTASDHVHKLEQDIFKLVTEPLTIKHSLEDGEEYEPSEEESESDDDHSTQSLPSFYESAAYQNFIKLKLLVKGNVSACNLKLVTDIYNDLASKQTGQQQDLLQHVSPSTVNRLVKYKLVDLCIIDICHCIHEYFHPQRSVFNIYGAS